jgi:EAL domain-containing protein (putative c-di-GMP-specific phosphodiesterase class I)
LGVKLYIDDFGTGYSSLSYLHRFPLDAIKIDRSFINSIQDSEASSGLVSTIIKLAHTLNMSVVAEGVETSSQRSILENLMCDEGQGFYFSKAIDKFSIESSYLQKSQADRTIYYQKVN